MDHILSVANHKGGVGKTTSAVNIGAVYAEMGKEVLLIDLDPQGGSTIHFGIESDGSDLLKAMQNAVSLPVVQTGIDNMSLVPSGPVFAEARQRFTGVLGTELLARSFSRTAGSWDVVIVDCPPSLDMLTMNALRVSRHVLVPLEANRLAMNSLGQVVETVGLVKKENRSLEILGIVVCRAHPRHRIHKSIMTDIERAFPGKVAPVVRESVSLAEAPEYKMPVTAYAPDSAGAADYRAVAQWLAQKIGISV